MGVSQTDLCVQGGELFQHINGGHHHQHQPGTVKKHENQSGVVKPPAWDHKKQPGTMKTIKKPLGTMKTKLEP